MPAKRALLKAATAVPLPSNQEAATTPIISTFDARRHKTHTTPGANPPGVVESPEQAAFAKVVVS